MASPIGASAPGYFIYRDTPPGKPFDPTALPTFFPAKESDELFDALRAKYPHVKSHSERMRDAIIEFLIEERQVEELSHMLSPTMPSNMKLPSATDTAATSPWQQSWSSVSTSTLSSPETMGIATPTFGNFPPAQPTQFAHELSNANSAATSSVAHASEHASPPRIDGMTGVFSVSTSEQPKQRVRRKMTEAEKIEYRKRRVVKACEMCQKRKRKCIHNHLKMETLTTASGKPSQVAKSRITTSTRPAASPPLKAHEPPIDLAFLEFDDSFAIDPALQPFDDFNLLLEEQIPQLQFDDIARFDQQNAFRSGTHGGMKSPQQQLLRPWSDTHDWTLMDPVDTNAFADALTPESWCSSTNITRSHANTNEALNFDQLLHTSNIDGSTTVGAGEQPLQVFSRHEVQPHATRTPYSGQQQQNGNGMLWDHLHTGQQEMTRAGDARDTLHLLGFHSSHLSNVADGSFSNDREPQVIPHGMRSPSAELFWLKRGIPSGMHSALDCKDGGSSRTFQPASALWTNPLLRTSSIGTSVSDTTGEAAFVRRATSCLPASAARTTSAVSRQAAMHSAPNDSTPSTQLLRPAGVAGKGKSMAVGLGMEDTHLERLSDHVRYRDHHGRIEREGFAELSADLATLGGILILASLLSIVANPSIFFLALLCPVPAAKGHQSEDPSWQTWSSFMRSMLPWLFKDYPRPALLTEALVWCRKVQTWDCTYRREEDSSGARGKDKDVMLGWGGIKWSGVTP